MNNDDCRISGPQAFVEKVIQGSQQRPIILVNGESYDLANATQEKMAKLIGEIDPSILCLIVENSTLANIEHDAKGGLFVPVGISLWWQGELAGSLLIDHGDTQF